MSITHEKDDDSYTRTNVMITKYQLRMCKQLRIQMSFLLRNAIDEALEVKKAAVALSEAEQGLNNLAQKYTRAQEFIARKGLSVEFSDESAK